MKTSTLKAVTLAGITIVLAGCASAAAPTATATPQPTPRPVLLTYIGNSCILITAPDGTRIVSDPYNLGMHSAGIRELPKDLTAEAVTISHKHSDHNNARGVQGKPQVFKIPGAYQVGEVKITGYAGWEGSPQGPSTLPETIFVYEIGEVRIVQLGDSGEVTDPDVLAAIDSADVIIVNIDGYVIPKVQLLPFLNRIHARTVLPAHYSHDAANRWCEAPTLEEFLASLPADMQVLQPGSQLAVTASMPVQVAAMQPVTLMPTSTP